MKIPVFVSCPTDLSPSQQQSRQIVVRQLSRFGLEPRALGRSDYPTEFPLREVLVIARHCSGGVILGFEQLRCIRGITKPGTPSEAKINGGLPLPTPWNQLEAGILFGLGLPLLIFREEGIQGGVFDEGVSDVFVHDMPVATDTPERRRQMGEVFLKWQADVRSRYYRNP
jgi:hypothetical protein